MIRLARPVGSWRGNKNTDSRQPMLHRRGRHMRPRQALRARLKAPRDLP
jgi:hypothetical protein